MCPERFCNRIGLAQCYSLEDFKIYKNRKNKRYYIKYKYNIQRMKKNTEILRIQKKGSGALPGLMLDLGLLKII